MTAKPWKWEYDFVGDPIGRHGWILRDGRGRNRANVWPNGTWHTWDERGTGGENGSCPESIRDAMDQTMAAVARQGWTPWKIEYPKAKATTQDKKETK